MTDSEDDLLRKLGQTAREQAGGEPRLLDERWDRLASGTLSAEEDAELRRLAESSTESREAYEAFRPLGGDFQARVVDAVAAHAASESAAVRSSEAAAARNAETAAKVLPFRLTVRRLAAWGAAMGAAAAALTAVMLRPPPLPAYALAELSGGSRMTRGELVETPALAPGDHFQVSLRPETAVRRAGLLLAQAFLLRGGELRPLAVETTEVDPSGAVRLSGTLDRDLAPGPWTLWLVVGRRGTLPDPQRLRSFVTTSPVRERNWVAVPAPLTIGSSAKG
ncbi:MAG TPA: hypothetical protein VGS57_13915 [Thermoanaerobaculia bacterium]|jgi:hypothetical protein|nr:hypothetical protein [Thermoanaerobaculia bacterium]